jgi:competence protein ComEC
MAVRARTRVLEQLSFATAPALYAALWLCAGIVLEPYLSQHDWIAPGVLIVATSLLITLSLLAARGALRVALLPLACTWLLLGILLSEIEPAPDPQMQLRLIADDGGATAVEGAVTRTTPIRLTESTLPFGNTVRVEQSESVDLRIASAAGQPVAGGLRATLYGPADQPFPLIHCGDQIRAVIALHVPERYLDPGVWDATAWLRQQGIGVVGSLKASAVVLTHGSGRGSFACWLHSVQEAGSQRLIDFATASASAKLPEFLRLSTTDAGMLSAMILGDRTYLEHQARVGFERTGSFHLLVVSGMHLAIFAGCIFALAALLRLPRCWSTALTIICSFGYALLAGFGEPVQRSFWMVTLYLLARLLFRERNSLNAIGFAALCLLALDPRSLSGASFQMTLLSVLIVAGVTVPIAEHTFGPYLQAARNLGLTVIDPDLPPRLAQFRVTLRLIADHLQPFLGRRVPLFLLPAFVRLGLRICELLLVSATIELAMSLPMAIYFHRITALGLPVNLLVVPLIGLALPSALITFAALLIWPSVAFAPAIVTAALLHTITGIVQLFSGMEAGDIRISNPGGVAIVAGILLIGAAVWAARNSPFPVVLPIAALACSAASVFYPRALAYHPGQLEVTAIDVGQGDSLLLVSPQGRTLLIDAGGPTGGTQAAHGNFEIGEDVVSPVLWSRNIRRLDAIALTHAHSDHMGGMLAVIKNFRPRVLWVGRNPNIPAYAALLAEAQRLGIQVDSIAAGDHFAFGGAQVEVLAPPPGYIPGPTATHDDSLVLHVSYGHTSVLLEGDAQAASERLMLSEGLHADLLKVGHHGSKTSTTPAFLAAVAPTYAIISVAHRNPYGHPKWEVLDRLQEERIRTFRTDALGATSFYLNGSSVSAQPLEQFRNHCGLVEVARCGFP